MPVMPLQSAVAAFVSPTIKSSATRSTDTEMHDILRNLEMNKHVYHPVHNCRKNTVHDLKLVKMLVSTSYEHRNV